MIWWKSHCSATSQVLDSGQGCSDFRHSGWVEGTIWDCVHGITMTAYSKCKCFAYVEDQMNLAWNEKDA